MSKAPLTQDQKTLFTEDLKEAEAVILMLYQNSALKDKYKIHSNIKTSEDQKLENRLTCLDIFIDENNVIRVGGRLKQLSLECGALNPVLLSKTGNVTKIIVKSQLNKFNICMHCFLYP